MRWLSETVAAKIVIYIYGFILTLLTTVFSNFAFLSIPGFQTFHLSIVYDLSSFYITPVLYIYIQTS